MGAPPGVPRGATSGGFRDFDFPPFDGLCAETDPELWFPEKGGSTRDAKAVCARCYVRVECLEWALDHAERYGIWGGASERERRKMRTERGLTDPNDAAEDAA